MSDVAKGNPVTTLARNELEALTFTIALGESLSAAVDLGIGRVAVAVRMPAAWDAADMTFQANEAGGATYYNVYDAAVERSLAVAASRLIALDPNGWAGVRYLKLRSGSASTPVNQSAAREIVVLTRTM